MTGVMVREQTFRHLKPVMWLFVVLQALLFSPRLNSDGAYYYEYLRSWVLQNDFNFADEREFFTWEWVPVIKDYLPGGWEETGYPPNIFSFGPAMLWMPFFLLGHIIAWTLKSLGLPVSTTGYGVITRFLPMMSSVLAGLGALYVMDRIGRRAGFDPPDRAAGLLFLLGASHLPAFLFVTPAFAHAFSVFFSALFLYIWFISNRNDFSTGQFALFGAIVGFAVVVRWQNFLLLALPAIDFANDLWENPRLIKKKLLKWITFGIALSCVVMPQLLVTKTLYGKWVIDPQGDGGMLWMSPRFRLVLFDKVLGLFSVNPILLPALLVLPFLWWRSRRMAWGLLVVVISQSYINAIRRDWAGVGFGMRRFLNIAPGFALGLMVLFAWARPTSRRWLRRVLVGLGCVLIGWNLLLMAQYYLSKFGAPWTDITSSEIIRAQFTQSPVLLAELMGTSLMMQGFRGDGISLLLGLLGVAISLSVFLLLPKIDVLLRRIWRKKAGLFLGFLSAAWVTVICWLVSCCCITPRMYHIVDLYSANSIALTSRCRLNPSTGYQGTVGGLVFGPGSQVQARRYLVQYDKNRFLFPGTMTRIESPFHQADQRIYWVFPEPVEAEAVELVSRLEGLETLAGNQQIGRIILVDIHGDKIHLPVTFRKHTGCSKTHLPENGSLIERRWPAINPIETDLFDTLANFSLAGPRLITSLEISFENQAAQWFVRGIALLAPARSMKPLFIPESEHIEIQAL